MGRKWLPLFLILTVMMTGAFLFAAEEVRQAQIALQERGYNPGPIDGIMGPMTSRAISDFQRQEGMRVTGRLDADVREALNIRAYRRTSAGGDLVVPDGTEIQVLLNERLDSGQNNVGDRFTLTVTEDVRVRGGVAIPEGTLIRGRVTEVERARRPQKGGKLALEPESVVLRGQTLPLSGRITAHGDDLEGRGSLEEDLKEIAIAAGIGAVIGGLAEGKGGALAGLLIGGGGTFVSTKGEQVELPSETELMVELTDSLRID